MPKIQFALALVGPSDDLLIRVFDSEETLRQFAALNPPAPVEGAGAIGHGPLFEATKVRGQGPACAIGYLATKLEDGVPTTAKFFYGGDTDRLGFTANEPFDPSVPLFYQPESAV